jgi:hypothetical protein
VSFTYPGRKNGVLAPVFCGGSGFGCGFFVGVGAGEKLGDGIGFAIL